MFSREQNVAGSRTIRRFGGRDSRAHLAKRTAEVHILGMPDFIKVHHLGDDKEVLLNRDHIVSVEDNQNGCIVTLSTGATMKLTETAAVLRK
jgi:hypothetical protein